MAARPVKPTRRDRVWLVATVLLAGVFHWPSLDTGYVSDDARLSLAPGEALAGGIDMVQLAGEYHEHFVSIGRFFPLALTVLLGFFLLPTLLAYKLSKLLTLMAVLGLWGGFVRRLTGCTATALLSVLCCAVLFQYRLYHDPVLSFGWQLPQAMAFFLGGLHLQINARERTHWLWSLASALLFACSFLTYEVMLPLVAVHLCLAPWRGRVRAALASVSPHLLVSVAFALLLLVLRQRASPPPGPQTEMSLDPAAMLVLVVRQAFAALPLSYGWASEAQLLDARSLGLGTGAVLVAAWVMLIARRALLDLGPEPHKSLRPLVVMALLLLALPSLMIAPSAKYQHEVLWGIGYLPVFVSVFGVSALLSVGLVSGLRRLRRPPAQYALLALLVPLTVVGYQRNRAAVEILADQWNHPRALLRDSLSEGLLEAATTAIWVESGSRDSPWQTPAFFTMEGGFTPEAVWSAAPPPDRLAPRPGEASAPPGAPHLVGQPLRYVSYGSASAISGLAVAGSVDWVVQTGDEGHHPLGSRARIFLQGSTSYGAGATFGYFEPLPHRARLDFDEVETTTGQRAPRQMRLEPGSHTPALTMLDSGDDWQLWILEAGPGQALALDSIRIITLPP